MASQQWIVAADMTGAGADLRITLAGRYSEDEALASGAVETREEARYDGYASCPLTTSRGRIMLAEFGYDGVIMPSFAADPRIPLRRYWWLKKYLLPWLYWELMLQGRPGPDWHRGRDFPDAVPALRP